LASTPRRRGTEGKVAVVVFFDVAGTLIRVRDGVGAQYARVAARFGVTADPPVLEREFPRAFRSAPRMAFPGAPPEAIPRLERQVWLGIVKEVFAGAGLLPVFPPGAFDAYFDAVYRHFEDPGVWEVFPDVVPSLSALRALGCPLGIVSNFDGRAVRILEGLNLAPWFASITLSSQVGATKPDPTIFHRALARHGTVAAHACHVGDSPAEDCEGARAAGLRAVLIDRTRRYPDRPGFVRVESLIALAEIVRARGEQVAGSDPT
jgi:putative hydrolase of the HAD superfamily